MRVIIVSIFLFVISSLNAQLPQKRTMQLKFTSLVRVNTNEFENTGDLTMSEDNVLEGDIITTVGKISKRYAKAYENKMNAKAITHVIGYYDEANKKIILMPLSQNDPDNVAALERQLELTVAANNRVSGINRVKMYEYTNNGQFTIAPKVAEPEKNEISLNSVMGRHVRKIIQGFTTNYEAKDISLVKMEKTDATPAVPGITQIRSSFITHTAFSGLQRDRFRVQQMDVLFDNETPIGFIREGDREVIQMYMSTVYSEPEMKKINQLAESYEKKAYGKTTIDQVLTVDDLWKLYRGAKPLMENNPEWKKAGTQRITGYLCMSGNCDNGQGIAVTNNGGYTISSQHEGWFRAGKPYGVGVATNSAGGKTAGIFRNGPLGAYLVTEASGYVGLRTTGPVGLTLAEVQRNQEINFAGLKVSPNTLRSVNVSEVVGEKSVTLDVEGLEDRHVTTTQAVKQNFLRLKNTGNKTVWIKATRVYVDEKTGKKSFLDQSFALEPEFVCPVASFRQKVDPANTDYVQYLGIYIAPVDR